MNVFKNKLPYQNKKIKYIESYDPKEFQKYFLDLNTSEMKKLNCIRQYYHIPPQNDIHSYKRFLFPCVTSCKYNKLFCTPFKDLRVK